MSLFFVIVAFSNRKVGSSRSAYNRKCCNNHYYYCYYCDIRADQPRRVKVLRLSRIGFQTRVSFQMRSVSATVYYGRRYAAINNNYYFVRFVGTGTYIIYYRHIFFECPLAIRSWGDGYRCSHETDFGINAQITVIKKKTFTTKKKK